MKTQTKYLLTTLLTISFAASFSTAQTIKSTKSWPKIKVSKKTYNFDTTNSYDDVYYEAKQTETKTKKILPKLKKVVKEATTSTKIQAPKKRLKKKTTKKIKRKYVQSNTSKLKTSKTKNPAFHLSPFAGASFFTLSGNLLQNSFQNGIEHELGFAGGALFEYHKPTSLFGFETGAFFLQTGAKGDDRIVNSINPFSLSFLLNEYIVVPLAVKLYPFAKKGLNIYVKAGASGGFLTSSTIEQFSIGTLNSQTNTSNSFTNFDLQGLAGLGAKFNIMSNIAINLEATYNRSLINISDLNNGLDAFNDGFIAALGITVSL